MQHGYDVCDGDGCGVKSNRHPFPHADGCKYGTGDPSRDRQIRMAALKADEEECARRFHATGEGGAEPGSHCLAIFREEPMPDTVYCREKGPHSRHTAWESDDYYAWLDGDEGAGWDPMQ